MSKDPVDRLRRLKQTDDIWEGTIRLARAWITPKNEEPFRPWLVAVVDKKGPMLVSKLSDDPPTNDAVWDAISRAMRRPMIGAGRPRRPAVIHIDHEEHVKALAPKLEAIGVRCEFRQNLPVLTESLVSMEQWMNRGQEPLPGLITLPGMTPPLLEHLYAAAAEFYEAAPWRILNDLHPIEIRYPSDASERYAVVMGSGGEIYGLSVQDSLDDLQWMLQDLAPEDLPHDMSWVGLIFEEAPAMSYDDLDAIARYGWPMPDKGAYPLIYRTGQEKQLKSPTRQDLLWLAGALPACVMYFKKHLRHSRGVVRPVELTLEVSVLGSTEEVYLRVPAFSTRQEAQESMQAADPLARSGRSMRTRKQIKKNLTKALLEDGLMSRALFEYELEEHIDEYLQSKHDDADKYFFSVTENSNEVAMLLIDEKDVVHVNEEALAILKKLWQDAYRGNLVKMIPDMAAELASGYLYIAGVKVVGSKPKK